LLIDKKPIVKIKILIYRIFSAMVTDVGFGTGIFNTGLVWVPIINKTSK